MAKKNYLVNVEEWAADLVFDLGQKVYDQLKADQDAHHAVTIVGYPVDGYYDVQLSDDTVVEALSEYHLATKQAPLDTAQVMKEYINSIRNAQKKEYAVQYVLWLKEGQGIVDEPKRSYGLSAMAAQAVRLHVAEILKS